MAIVDIEGVGLVEVPDNITDDQLSEVAKRMHKGRAASFGASIAQEPGRMAGGAVSGLARLGQAFGDSFGAFGGEAGMSFQEPAVNPVEEAQRPPAQREQDLQQNELFQAGENLKQGAQEAFQPNPLYADKFETGVASGIGSVIGLLPSALAGPAAPLAAGAMYGLSAGEDMAQEAGQVIDSRIAEAKAKGDTTTAATLEREKFNLQTAAFLAGVPIGSGTEIGLGVASRLAPMAAGKKTVVSALVKKAIGSMENRPIAKAAIEGAFTEGAQETLEQVTQNLAAREIYDPNRKLTEGVVGAGGAGAVVGALFGGGAGALARRRAAPTRSEKAVAPESSNEVDRMLEELANAPIATTPTDEEAITPPLEVPQPRSVTENVRAGTATPKVVTGSETPAGTAAKPPTPESIDTLAEQLAQTMSPDSTKSVTLVTPGEEVPTVPAGADVTETPHGVAISNPEKITPEAVAEAGAGPVFSPAPLGMGAAVEKSDTAVTTKTPEGTEVVSELATPETIPAAVKAQQEAVPGGVTEVVPADEVISGRQPQAPATEEPKAPAAVPDSGQASPAAAGEPAGVVAPKRKAAKKIATSVRSSEAPKTESERIAAGTKTVGDTAKDRIEAALDRAIEATKLEPGAFEFTRAIPQAALNAILRAARVLYRAGRSLTEAIQEAIRQHRIDNPADQFDDAEMEQAVTEAIKSGQVIPPAAAPGTQTQMSEGLFTGPITKDTDRQWDEAAKEWVDQFGDDLQTAVEKATSTAVQMDPALRQYVLTEIVSRSNQQAEQARNSVDTLKALRIQERAANALKDSGAQEFGKVGAARALAFKRIEGLMPVLAYRNLIRQAQDRLPFPEVTSDKVRKWLKKAGSKAVAEVRASMRKADNVVARELKREVRDMGKTWREILTSSLDVQGDHRRALYARVFAHPELQGISPAGATEIVNLLADEWERQRMRIFRQEFRKEVPLPGVRENDLKKLEESLPAIVIQANLGMLDNETFRNAIAPKYGVATFDGPTAEKVNKLAQAAQAAPEGVVRSRILAQMMDAIRRSDTVQFKDIFRDYWFAAMLSGIRTQVDNGMSILNGVINTGMAMARNPKATPLIGAAYLRGFGEAAADFVPILKGERWRMHNVDLERPASALEALKQSQNVVARFFGNAAFVSRLIGALDHLNALSTREAMKAWAMYRISPEDARRALSVSKEDLDAARERAIQENTPKTLLNKRVREILEERIPVEAILSATDMGRQVSFQNEPYGLLGHFYRFIQNASNMEGKGRAKGAEADRFRQTTGAFLRIISGTAFARYALNYTNDILNYVAPVGLYRWYQSSPANEGRSGLEFSPEFRELLITKSILGTLVATVAAAVFLGDDDDDERKRAIDITGSFRGLDSKKRNQLLSEGRQPYSIRIGDKYISYRQLPIAGVLGTVGEMRDRQLFDRKAFNQDSVAGKLANAGLAGALIVRDSSALVGLMDLLGFAQTYKYDTEGILQKSLPKFAARTLGSLIPNIAKELDAWTDPGLYRANAGWEYFMQQVPWVRREIPPGPAVDVFGDKISVERKPWSRWVKERKQDPEWQLLGDLASKGVFLPLPGPWKIVQDDGTRRDPTPAEMQEYQKKVGAEYRTFIRDRGAELLQMDPDEARQEINRETSAIRKDVRADLE